jgi:6-pyruvoyltetrahydropterin/6-carboxytetrahydropterin synthase
MTLVRLTRAVRFSAAHRYFRPEWSLERNTAEFGACSSEHGHGHAYECHVTVAGEVAPQTDMVVNLRELDTILREEVVNRFDHKHLNYDVPEFAFGNTIPTCEALAVHIWGRVQSRLRHGLRLEAIRVQEDPFLYAEYRGEAAAP